MKLKSTSKYIVAPLKVIITVVILLFVICFLQFIIAEIGFALTYKSGAQPDTRRQGPLWRVSRSKKEFLPDATIHLIHTLEYSRFNKLNRQEWIYDANDNLLWEGIRKDRPYKYLFWAQKKSGLTDRRMTEMQIITPAFSRSLEIPVNSQGKTEQVWRYDPAEDLFVGYRIKGGKIGFFGSTGFTDSKVEAKPFGKFRYSTAWVPGDSFSPTLLWQTDSRIYQIDFEKQQVNLLFESPEAKIGWVRLHRWVATMPKRSRSVSPAPSITGRAAIHCLTSDGKHHLIIRNPEQKMTITVPEDWRSGSVKLTTTKQNVFLYHSDSDIKLPEGISKWSKDWQKWWQQYRSKPHKNWVELYKVDNNGGLELLNRFDWTVPAYPVTETKDLRMQIYSCVRKVSPPVYDLAWHFWADRLYQHSLNGFGMTKECAQLIDFWRPGGSIMNWLLSAAMMGFVIWHGWARRTSWSKFLFWLILVGLFNLAGMLAYWALNHTAVIKCPTCGKHRGLTGIVCVRCGAELAVPEQRKVDLIFST